MMRECVDYLSKVVYEQCMSILLAPAALPLILLHVIEHGVLLQCPLTTSDSDIVPTLSYWIVGLVNIAVCVYTSLFVFPSQTIVFISEQGILCLLS